MKRLFVFLLLSVSSLGLSSCALVQTPINLIQGLAGALARTVDTDGTSAPPSRTIHLEPLNPKATPPQSPSPDALPSLDAPVPAQPAVAYVAPGAHTLLAE